MYRQSKKADFRTLYEIINTAAAVYKGAIPDDRWKEPYMSEEELAREIEDGVVFWCWEQNDVMTGVMGIQDVKDVTLIRHAYTRPASQRQGIGSKLLHHLAGRSSASMGAMSCRADPAPASYWHLESGKMGHQVL